MIPYYLSCTNCNKLNEIKSEYQTFCQYCNKKLLYNYQEWKKSNPDKSFNNFKEAFGVRADKVVLNHQKKEIKIPKQIITGIGVLFGVILGYYLFDQSNIKLINLFNFHATNKEILEKEWIQETYLGGLTLTTPYELEKGELNLPLELKSLIEKHELYQSRNKKGFYVMVNCNLFRPEVGNFSLEGAALGSVNEVKSQKGISDFFYTQKSFNLNTVPGFIQRGSFKQDGYDIEFINTGFNSGYYFWNILVACHINDETGKIAAERVINSILINPEID